MTAFFSPGISLLALQALKMILHPPSHPLGKWARQPARKTVGETNAWVNKLPYSTLRTTIDRLVSFLERVTSSMRVGVVKGVMLGHVDSALGFERWINPLWSMGIKGSWKSSKSLKILWLKCWVTETVVKMGLCGWLNSFTGHMKL